MNRAAARGLAAAAKAVYDDALDMEGAEPLAFDLDAHTARVAFGAVAADFSARWDPRRGFSYVVTSEDVGGLLAAFSSDEPLGDVDGIEGDAAACRAGMLGALRGALGRLAWRVRRKWDGCSDWAVHWKESETDALRSAKADGFLAVTLVPVSYEDADGGRWSAACGPGRGRFVLDGGGDMYGDLRVDVDQVPRVCVDGLTRVEADGVAGVLSECGAEVRALSLDRDGGIRIRCRRGDFGPYVVETPERDWGWVRVEDSSTGASVVVDGGSWYDWDAGGIGDEEATERMLAAVCDGLPRALDALEAAEPRRAACLFGRGFEYDSYEHVGKSVL